MRPCCPYTGRGYHLQLPKPDEGAILATKSPGIGRMSVDPAKSARFSGSVPSNDRLTASIPAGGTIYDCPTPPTGRSCPRNRRESGECRMKSLVIREISVQKYA